MSEDFRRSRLKKQIAEGRAIPPCLLLQRNSGVEVPYEQSIRPAQELTARGASLSAVCVDGAGHERDFRSQAVYEEILAFPRQILE